MRLHRTGLLLRTFKWTWFYLSSSLLANSRVERCRTDDLMPNVPISRPPPSRVNPKGQGLKGIIDYPQPGRPTGLLHSAGGLNVAAVTR